MKKFKNKALGLGLLIVFNVTTYAQNIPQPEDDLGQLEDKFQDAFFEGIKQKSIENYDKAVIAFQQCLNLDSNVPAVYFEMGKAYMQLKSYNNAEKSLKQAVSLNPNNQWFLEELYNCYNQQGDVINAVSTLQQLVKYNPFYKEELAALYVKSKKYNEALSLLDELDAAYGETKKRDFLRNEIYKLTGKKQDQIKNLETRVGSDPNNESNYLALIYRYSQNNEHKKAFDTAKELLQAHPNSQLVHLALYKFYLEENNIEKAKNSIKVVLESNDIKLESKQKVLTDFIQFVNKNPQYENDLSSIISNLKAYSNSMIYLEMGGYYLKKEQLDKALVYFEQALQNDPQNFQTIKSTLILYVDLQKFNEAELLSTKALELFPSQPLFYLVNGISNNALNKPDKAILSLETGLDFTIDDIPMTRDMYEQLSKAYRAQNNPIKAKFYSDKVNKTSK